jgi:CRP/FNR family transcriptional regulator
MTEQGIKEQLRRTPLFCSLSESELGALARRTVQRSCQAGELLFCEGDSCLGLYVIAQGRIRIFKMSPAGRQQVLAVEGPGNSIAELPVFDGGPYPASAEAVEEAQLLFVSKDDFRSLCLEHPEVALKVLQVVGSRLRRLVGIIEELSFTTVRQRLIAWILRRVNEHGPRFTLQFSHQELAAEIGTVRELVTRNLNRLQAEGLLVISGRELTVADPKALEAELRLATGMGE